MRSAVAISPSYLLAYREANGSGWRTDYPWAQRNLLIRLSELTKVRVSSLTSNVPHVYLVRLTDPALFQCGYLMGPTSAPPV